MKVFPFIAQDAADAVRQIREQLGPDAVVLNVRQLPAEGISKLWKKGRIEVLACLPEDKEALASPREPLRETEPTSAPASRPLAIHGSETAESSIATIPPAPKYVTSADRVVAAYQNTGMAPAFEALPTTTNRQWASGSILEKMGLLPMNVERILERIQLLCGNSHPQSLQQELSLAKTALLEYWKPGFAVQTDESIRPHLFIGPPGTGKTTALCKWLAQCALMEGRPARVWRLDGRSANVAESLSVYGEILGVPVMRSWDGGPFTQAPEIGFIDLPGIDYQDGDALKDLHQRLVKMPPTCLHLVLNAAYTTPLLMAQARAFSLLPINDLIFTHLDEEKAWGKLWNFALGTNYPIRFLAAGQNIPGQFIRATPEQLLPPQFLA